MIKPMTFQHEIMDVELMIATYTKLPYMFMIKNTNSKELNLKDILSNERFYLYIDMFDLHPEFLY